MASPLDPQLEPLTDFGIQKARRPETSSIVVSRGSNPLGLQTDQIGIPRNTRGAVDIGAAQAAGTTWSIDEPSVIEGNDGTTHLVFTVQLVDPTAPFTIDVQTVSGTATAGPDYQTHSETLSFQGAIGEQATVTVTVIGDTDFESNETVLLRFDNISDTSIPLPADAIGTILNDESGGRIRIENGVLQVDGTPANDTIQLALSDGFVGVTLNDDESGSFPADEVTRVVVRADAGADFIDATSVPHDIRVFAGAGNDSVTGGRGDDELFGGPGNDQLNGWMGADLIRGDNGDDSLLGRQGTDTLRGGGGNDTLFAGAGNDVALGDAGHDELEGGSGSDTLRGGGGDDTVSGSDGIDRISGGGGRDVLNGGGSNDRMGGGSGPDRMNGGAGHDYMNAGPGPDTLVAGAGNDTLLGREGHDVLLGEDGDDQLVAWTGRDIVYGGNGADDIQGRGDEDILIPGSIVPAAGLTVLEHLSGGIRDEWLSKRTYQVRSANITDSSGGSENKANQHFLIGAGRTGSNVVDDSTPDTLNGGVSLDLFFVRVGSDLTDRRTNEVFETL